MFRFDTKIRITIFLLVVFSCLSVQVESFPFSDDGITNPPSFWQRFRLKEFNEKRPFFQWWYFAIQDFDKSQTFIFTYGYSKCIKTVENNGAYIMIGYFDRATKERWSLYYKFPLDQFKYTQYFNVSYGNAEFQLEPIDDNTLNIKGKMLNPSQAWFSKNCTMDRKVTWDLQLKRIEGWYGEQDLEIGEDIMGLIGWNTFAHDSLISGKIIVDNKVFAYTNTPRFRIYADMNWGDYLPNGKGRDFAWGWFNIIFPAADPQNDVAIIAGTGKTWTDDLIKASNGSFCNIKIKDEREGFRQVVIWEDTPEEDIVLATAGKNEKLYEYTVIRTDWKNITDKLGTSEIPLSQVVIIKSSKWSIEMNYNIDPELMSRMVFASENGIFSDWEGFNLDAQITVKDTTGKIIYKNHSKSAGISFGAQWKINFPTAGKSVSNAIKNN